MPEGMDGGAMPCLLPACLKSGFSWTGRGTYHRQTEENSNNAPYLLERNMVCSKKEEGNRQTKTKQNNGGGNKHSNKNWKPDSGIVILAQTPRTKQSLNNRQ